MPSTPYPAGAATTQPMSVPRTGSTGLKPARPGVSQSTRSTQRIVLPTPPGGRPATRSLSMNGPGGRISLPIGMILRCLPPEVLAADITEFEKNGTAATEIGLPMNSILGQLPSGKVEMTLQELVPHFPAGFLQPEEAIASYLPNVVSLPLMDVVMRIPPDLLALRPDQKDVDAAVINMADPFTEEILREQAEAARRQSGANIIDESQAPQEEFVPRDRATAPKSVAPPRRPTVEPLIPSRTTATTISDTPAPPLRPPAVTHAASPKINPLVPTGRLTLPMAMAPAAPYLPQTPPDVESVPPPPKPATSEPNSLPIPTRTTIPLPRHPSSPAAPVLAATSVSTPAPTPSESAPLPATASAPVPPVPRHTGPIPAPPPPRHTTSLPTIARRTGSLASLSQRVGVKADVPKPTIVEKPAEETKPDAPTDDLQRLAALAMAQLGDETAPAETPAPVAEAPVETPAVETPAAEEPAPDAIGEPVPETPAPVAAEPEPVAAASAEPAPTPVSEPIRAPAPVDTGTPAMAFNVNTCSADDLVQNIPGCTRPLATAIVAFREKIGSFKRVEDLIDVPGMTREMYTNLTGEAPPVRDHTADLNDLLGFPPEQHLTLKDVTDRIACWPDVTGCLLSQSTGLSLVGTAPRGFDKEAIVAFAPRMFDSLNKSFAEVAGQETDAMVIPTVGTSFHLFRNGDLYLIILSRLPQMPDRHLKVARYALAALATRKD